MTRRKLKSRVESTGRDFIRYLRAESVQRIFEMAQHLDQMRAKLLGERPQGTLKQE